MKIKNLLLAGLVPLAFFSCQDKDVDAVGNSAQPEAYFNLQLSFSESSTSRAGEPTTTDEDGDGYQTGLGTEQRFQNVAVILVNTANVVTDYVTYTEDEFAPDGNSAIDDTTISGTPVFRNYVTKKAKLVTKGDASVYVFLNPTAEIASKYAVGNSINTAGVEMNTITSDDLTTTIALNDNFLMGNAETPTVVTIDGSSTNPTTVSIAVERAVTKLVENTTTTRFTLENTLNATNVSASFVSYAYNNLNKRYYATKQLQQRSGANAFTGNYVVDPNFTESDYNSFSPSSPWYGNDFFTIGNENVNKGFTPTNNITYALENTMISNEQYTNKTTCVVYKSQLTVDGSNATFYTYKNRIYTSYADLESVYNADYPAIDNALANLFTEAQVTNAYENSGNNYSNNVLALNEKLANRGIKCYYGGVCYYNWPIKHWEQDEHLGRMEFGIVRNNVYYLEVTKVSAIGEPWVPGGPEDPDPEPVPDEFEDAHLIVDITVLPWILRYNNIEF